LPSVAYIWTVRAAGDAAPADADGLAASDGDASAEAEGLASADAEASADGAADDASADGAAGVVLVLEHATTSVAVTAAADSRRTRLTDPLIGPPY
jgi:hypothetical protein